MRFSRSLCLNSVIEHIEQRFGTVVAGDEVAGLLSASARLETMPPKISFRGVTKLLLAVAAQVSE